jgi:hypothetical protein
MTAYELVQPMDNSKELVIGLFSSGEEAYIAMCKYVQETGQYESTFTVRKIDDEEYM